MAGEPQATRYRSIHGIRIHCVSSQGSLTLEGIWVLDADKVWRILVEVIKNPAQSNTALRVAEGDFMHGMTRGGLVWTGDEDQEGHQKTGCTTPATSANDSVSNRSSAANHDDHLDRLAETIEGEIIPRLMLAHRALRERESGDDCRGRGSPAIWDHTPANSDRVSAPVRELARMVVGHDRGDPLIFLQQLRDEGMALDALFVEVLAPTARYLGDLWNDDLCDFTDVTVGLCRLHQMALELSYDFRNRCTSGDRGRRILLCPASGEQHTFGLLMVSEFFRKAGWDVRGGPSTPLEEAERCVGQEWFDVVGISIACDRWIDRVSTAVHQIRQHSCNPAIGVMVGGSSCIRRPDLVTLVGADTTAIDARQAPQQAEHLLALLTQR